MFLGEEEREREEVRGKKEWREWMELTYRSILFACLRCHLPPRNTPQRDVELRARWRDACCHETALP